jgi:hypothetical protein
MSKPMCITEIPATCTNATVTYSIDGDRHTIEGHPADLYVQLDVLFRAYRTFRLLGAAPKP